MHVGVVKSGEGITVPGLDFIRGGQCIQQLRGGVKAE